MQGTENRKGLNMEVEYLLSKREIQILELISQGYSNLEINQELKIKDATVHTHIANIYSKLHLDESCSQYSVKRVRAALWFLENREKLNK